MFVIAEMNETRFFTLAMEGQIEKMEKDWSEVTNATILECRKVHLSHVD
jgi:hypothetical protein